MDRTRSLIIESYSFEFTTQSGALVVLCPQSLQERDPLIRTSLRLKHLDTKVEYYANFSHKSSQMQTVCAIFPQLPPGNYEVTWQPALLHSARATVWPEWISLIDWRGIPSHQV